MSYMRFVRFVVCLDEYVVHNWNVFSRFSKFNCEFWSFDCFWRKRRLLISLVARGEKMET